MQAQGHVQVLVNMIDFGMNVQEAGEAPRIEHVGSPTPTGKAGDKKGGTIKAERGIPAAVIADLERRGHQVKGVNTNGGGYQAIMIDPRDRHAARRLGISQRRLCRRLLKDNATIKIECLDRSAYVALTLRVR